MSSSSRWARPGLLASVTCGWWGFGVSLLFGSRLGDVGSPAGCCAPEVVVHPLETAIAAKQRGERLQKRNDQPSWESNRRVETQRSGAGKWSGCPSVGGMGQLLRSALRIIHSKIGCFFSPFSLLFFPSLSSIEQFLKCFLGNIPTLSSKQTSAAARAVFAPLWIPALGGVIPGFTPSPLPKAMLPGYPAQAEP